MIALGIDVSKNKSTIAILNSDRTVRAKPFNVQHNQVEMNALVEYLKSLDDQLLILMEYSGHYHYPVLKNFEMKDSKSVW